MKQRFITGAILIAIVIPTVYFGGILFDLLALAFVSIATHEILALFETKYPTWVKWLYYVIFVGSTLGVILNNNFVTFLSLLTLILLFTIALWVKEVTLYHIGISYLIYTILIYTICTILKMYDISKWLLAFTLICTYVNDSFCLFGGKLFGKHKLNPRISPNKTIEGSLSGIIVGALAGIILSLFTLKQLPISFILVSSITIPIVAQLGDLAFSAIKRHYGIKDFGTIFPGHGGVLDRVDSLGFSALWLFALMSILL